MKTKVGGITPLVASFMEEKIEHDVPVRPYLDEEQVGVIDPHNIVNPLYMSPTTLSTAKGDSEGDEAH